MLWLLAYACPYARPNVIPNAAQTLFGDIVTWYHLIYMMLNTTRSMFPTYRFSRKRESRTGLALFFLAGSRIALGGVMAKDDCPTGISRASTNCSSLLLLMLLTGQGIRETILFPLVKPERGQ